MTKSYAIFNGAVWDVPCTALYSFLIYVYDVTKNAKYVRNDIEQ